MNQKIQTLRLTWLFIFILATVALLSQDVMLDVPLRLNQIDTNSNGHTLAINGDGEIVVRKYRIGQIAHGGIVFYVDHSSIHGLVADTTDITNAGLWRNQSFIQTNARSQGMGAGAGNSFIVTALQAGEDPTEDFATLLCVKHDRGDYGDWYLPSLKELELLYNNLYTQALGNFPTPALTYWSSSEEDKTRAYAVNFSTGVSTSELKDIFFAVRAIRAF